MAQSVIFLRRMHVISASGALIVMLEVYGWKIKAAATLHVCSGVIECVHWRKLVCCDIIGTVALVYLYFYDSTAAHRLHGSSAPHTTAYNRAIWN